MTLAEQNGHDPLTGPEQAAAIARKEQEAKLVPFKIVGQLIGVHKDPEGNIVGEQVMGEVAIYSSQFGEVDQLVGEATK